MTDFLENYRQEKKTIDIVKANIYGLFLIIPWAIVFAVPYFFIWREQFTREYFKATFSAMEVRNSAGTAFLLFVVLIAGIIVHELIHGAFFGYYAKSGYKTIKFGIIWEYLTPYCHCNEPLKVKHYVQGAAAPGILLGIIPSIVAVANGSLLLLAFGGLFTIAAIGDLMIIRLIWKEDSNAYVQDHPSEAGCYIYRPQSSE